MPTTSRLVTMPSSLCLILVNIILKTKGRSFTQELSLILVTQNLYLKRCGSQSNDMKRPLESSKKHETQRRVLIDHYCIWVWVLVGIMLRKNIIRLKMREG